MKRTQIQIDEWIHEAVRQRAYQEGRSMSDLIRSLLAKTLKIKQPPAKLTIKDFTFIGAGHSQQSSLSPVSERHDEALQAVFQNGRR